MKVSDEPGFILRRKATATDGRACRRAISRAAWLWTNFGTVALAAVFSIFASATAAQAQTQFYVDSVGGSDSNAGTSSTSPWRSLAKVNGTDFQPGEVVNFKRGSVWTGTLKVKSSGVMYQGYGDPAADPPHIKNPEEYYGHAVDVTGTDNVVQHFLITDAHEAGVIIRAGADGNVVQGNVITRTGTGVMIAGQHNRAISNYVHDLRMIVNDTRPDNDYGAVCFWLQADHNEIAYNSGVNCKAPSYDFGYDGGFVEVWRSGDYLYIHHNYARNTNGFFELGADNHGSAQNIRVAYNVIVNVTGRGSGTSICFNTGSYHINVGAFRFENNTFVSTSGHPDAYRIFGCRNDLSALRVRNNIFYSDIQIASNGNFSHYNNLYYMVNMVSGSGVGYALDVATETEADPRFVNLAGGDYNLQLTSPAIDAGMNLGYTNDMDGVPVPQALASLFPDMGAYEYRR